MGIYRHLLRGHGVAGSGTPGAGTRWRVFVSHTSELRNFPAGGKSYIAEAERAIAAAGHVTVDMADFPAADQPAAELCAERVRGCDVYVGVLGTRYGSPVADRPEVSYTELEFDTATAAGLPRLMFLLDTTTTDVGIPLAELIDHQFGARQEAFRRRIQASGLVTQSFASPDELGRLVERSLRELAAAAIDSRSKPAGEGGSIFISYRRQESSHAGRLSDRLADRFGEDRIFIDVDTIEPGVDWREEIFRAVGACQVLLAVIGPGWLTATDERGGRRLDDPDDIVRLEIEAALAGGIRIIPILVEGAAMPGRADLPDSLAGLTRRNAIPIRHESFRYDTDRLVTALQRVIPGQ
jgi:hypothetical protein